MLGIWVIDAKMVSRVMDEKRLPVRTYVEEPVRRRRHQINADMYKVFILTPEEV